MNTEAILKCNDTENFSVEFLQWLCLCSGRLCRPVDNKVQEEEYGLCGEVLRQLESFIEGDTEFYSVIGAVGGSGGSGVISSVCGRIFKSREPVYVCRDCATDSTCVLCRTCFVNSDHIKHNYQMFSSNGGGFCDCGDLEAWKSSPRCKLHGGGANTENSDFIVTDNYDSWEDINSTIERRVPEGIQKRFLLLCRQLFANIKYFIMRPCCKDNEEHREVELERELSFVESFKSTAPMEDELALVLYNNEFHNFDQVINIFKRCLGCSAEQAMEYANIVDRDGRCVAMSVAVGEEESSVRERQREILSRSKLQTKVELLCKLHHSAVLALQSFLLHCLRWLSELVCRHHELRLLLCKYLFTDIKDSAGAILFPRSSFVQDVFENHIETWKMARTATSTFLMTVVMKESFFKKLFAIEFVKNYSMIVEHYSVDDHNLQDSLVSLSCQIFTIISLAKFLLDNYNVLKNVFQLVFDELLKHSKPFICDGLKYDSILTFNKDEGDLQKKFDSFERHMKSVGDANYLLNSLLTSFTGHEGEDNDKDNDYATGGETSSICHKGLQLWTDQSVNNFMDYFDIFAKILSLIQETNTIERVIEHHIEQDPQWRTGIILMYDLVPCITLTSNLVISNPVCWDRSFEMFRKIVKKRLVDFQLKKRVVFEYSGYKANVIDNNWPNKCISVIKPLHRFMAALLLREKYFKQLSDLEVDCLFDQALQMIVFTSQQAGNMWIRNGSVPYILTQQMKCLILTTEMFDRDVQLIQQLALCMKPEEFIVKCIHKFDLRHYFTSSSGILSEKKSLIQRVEDFLHLLIMTLFFRYRPGVGKNVTRETCYENIILHILCVKPMTHSKIMKKLPQSLQHYPKSKVMEIIDKVADQTKQSQIVMFNAKKSLIATKFDRFSLYYSIQERNEAELHVQSVLKKEVGAVPLTSPEPIGLSQDFEGLLCYISDPCFIRVLDRILLFSNEKRNSEYWTDTMLDMVLYLVGACLMEDLKLLDTPKESRRPLFLETASKSTLHIRIIDNLELLCDKITAEQQLELIKWTIRKWHEVQKKMVYDKMSSEEKNKMMEVSYQDLDMEMENVSVIHQSKINKADAAKKRREQLMDKMKNMQKKFINENVDLLIEPFDEGHQEQQGTSSRSLGHPELDLTCILCQEKSDSSYERPIVAIAGAWRSTVLAKHPFTSRALNAPETSVDTIYPPAMQSAQSPTNIYEEVERTNIFIESSMYEDSVAEVANDIDRVVARSILPLLDHPEETFITTCGHVMHYDCKTRYMSDMIKQKQNIARTKGVLYPRIYNRCPLCKCVCNIDIPIILRQEEGIIDLHLSDENVTTFDEWVNSFIHWAPQVIENKKVDRSMRWWDKLGHQLSNIMKMAVPFKRNDSQASDDDLLCCLAFRVGLAIKLQPRKLTKETYLKYEGVCNSISESSLQDIIELDYSVAYTMSVWEQILNKQSSSLLYDMPERHMLGLTYLIKAVNKSHEQFSEKDNLNRNIQSFLLLIQKMLFDCSKSSLHREWLDLHKYKVPLFILEVDFTYIMTTLVFMRCSFSGESPSPAMFSTHNSFAYNLNIVRLLYRFVSLQALLSLKVDAVDNVEVSFSQLQSDSPTIWTEDLIDRLYGLREELRRRLPSLSFNVIDRHQLAVCFSRAVMAFLRCSAFLLTSLGTLTTTRQHFANCDVEFNYLIGLFGLTVIPHGDLLSSSYIKGHLDLLVNHQNEELLTIWCTKLPHSLPPSPPTLIDLPLDFTDVLTLCLDRGCSLRQQSAGAVTEMTLCLVCGDTFCLNGYCCRRAEDSSLSVLNGAQIHSRQSHGGYSLFLNTRNSKIVVMFYQARWQIYLDPIYLDKYGENDVDLKKGSPLFLNSEAYAKLQRSWLDHSVGCIVNDSFLSNDFFV